MKIGDVINLTGQMRNEEEEFNYRCKIIDMEKDVLYVDYPIDTKTNKTVFLPLNEPFNVRFIQDTAVYQFRSQAIERTTKVMPVLKIVVPSKEKFEKIQRRAYLRVDTAVDIAIHCPDESFPPFTTVTKDLSGGGARFIVPYSIKHLNLESGQQIMIYLVLRFSQNKYEYIKVNANVVRILDHYTPQEISVSFEHEDIQIEQTLIQYCFHIQREERQQKL